ncbi:uncharacterized protein LOC115686828 [Syzygium oleosum]|uniref:uncharacterized protein LOC115686828 n=1 Tax=Syzygium oleosum TaxID=219896 RepID=UPI0024BB2AA4|nr:uncharacterized protein LOC115686828 [Syzygium oleosum]
MEESGGTPAHASLNPCVLVQEVVKAVLRCLGLETAQDPSPPPAAQASDPPPSSAAAKLDPTDPVEADDPPTTGETEDNQATFLASALTKPPINTGTGPQTN